MEIRFDGCRDSTFEGDFRKALLRPSSVFAINQHVHSIASVGDTVYVAGTTSSLGQELWRLENDQAFPVDVIAGSLSSNPRELLNVNGVLFFFTSDASGSVLRSLNSGVVSARSPTLSSATHLTNAGGTVYFSGPNGELWRVTGNNNADRVTGPTVPTGISQLTSVSTSVFFRGTRSGTTRLWSYNGTSFQEFANAVEPQNLTNLNGQLLFTTRLDATNAYNASLV